MRRIHPEIRQRARALRQPQTPAEQALWRYLQNEQLEGYKFRRSIPLGVLLWISTVDGPNWWLKLTEALMLTRLSMTGSEQIGWKDRDTGLFVLLIGK
jgi:hypothetical protein